MKYFLHKMMGEGRAKPNFQGGKKIFDERRGVGVVEVGRKQHFLPCVGSGGCD